MPITFVDAVAVAAASLSFPAATKLGDYEDLFEYRSNSATPPDLGNFWNQGSGGANTNAWRQSGRFASQPSDASGTLTNATHLYGGVYRGVRGWGLPVASVGSGATLPYPALTMLDSSGASVVVLKGAHRIATNVEGPPAGATFRAGVGAGPEIAGFDVGAVTGFAGVSQSVNATSGRVAVAQELLSYSCFNPFSKASSITLSSGQKVATMGGTMVDGGGIYDSVICTFPRFTGRYRFRMRRTSANGDWFSVMLATSAWSAAGSDNDTLGTATFELYNRDNGTQVTVTGAGNFTATQGQNLWADVFVDVDAKQVSYGINGVLLNGANPDAGTGTFSLAGLTEYQFGVFPAIGFGSVTMVGQYDGVPPLGDYPTAASFMQWDAADSLGEVPIRLVRRSDHLLRR